jgi:hypothetical protein
LLFERTRETVEIEKPVSLAISSNLTDMIFYIYR